MHCPDGVDTEVEAEEISTHRTLPMKKCCDGSTDIRVEPFSITIVYVHPNVAGKRVGKINTSLFS